MARDLKDYLNAKNPSWMEYLPAFFQSQQETNVPPNLSGVSALAYLNAARPNPIMNALGGLSTGLAMGSKMGRERKLSDILMNPPEGYETVLDKEGNAGIQKKKSSLEDIAKLGGFAKSYKDPDSGIEVGFETPESKAKTLQNIFKQNYAGSLNKANVYQQKKLGGIIPDRQTPMMQRIQGQLNREGLSAGIERPQELWGKDITSRQLALEDKKSKNLFNIESNKLRYEFINRPEVKDYMTVSSKINSMDELMNKPYSGENKLYLDQGLITIFNKISDPTSVVRESEYERTPQNLSLANRFSGAFQKLSKGGAGLTDDDRKALVFGAKVIANGMGKTYNQTLNEYNDLANAYGVKPEMVTRAMKPHQEFMGLQGTSTSGAGQGGQKIGKTAKGTSYQIID